MAMAPRGQERGSEKLSFQDQGATTLCYGCGPANDQGFRIKSRWDGEEAVGTWTARPHHCGGTREVVNGGVIATLLDCHSMNLAIARAYRDEQRPIGSAPRIFFVTASLHIDYRRPTPLGKPLELRAAIRKVQGRKTFLSCTLSCERKVCAEADVLAVRIHRDESVEPTR